jgi:hypothetical protein
MSDDLGRGQVGWPPDQWQELDTLAADTVGGQVVLRNVVDHQDVPGAFSVSMAGKNVDVGTISSAAFEFDMVEEDIEDLRRKVRDKAQELAKTEDIEVLKAMQPTTVNHAVNGALGGSRYRLTYGFSAQRLMRVLPRKEPFLRSDLPPVRAQQFQQLG